MRSIFVLYTQLYPTYQTIIHFPSYYKTAAVDDDGGGQRWRREMRGSHTQKREVRREKLKEKETESMKIQWRYVTVVVAAADEGE